MKLKFIIIVLLIFISLSSCKSKYQNKKLFIPNLTVQKIKTAFYSRLGFRYEFIKPDTIQLQQWGGGADFDIIVITPDSIAVTEYTIKAKIDTNFIDQQTVFEYAASKVYEGSLSSQIVLWVRKNYNNNAKCNFGIVTATMYAPSQVYRQLQFKVKESNSKNK